MDGSGLRDFFSYTSLSTVTEGTARTPGKSLVAMALSDMMTLPEYKYSTSSVKTAFQLSHNTTLSLFDYLKHNPSELEQWSKSVRVRPIRSQERDPLTCGILKSLGAASQEALITDYPWESLGPSVFVDCGGGHGYLSILLARK
jgi:hypothetical protein